MTTAKPLAHRSLERAIREAEAGEPALCTLQRETELYARTCELLGQLAAWCSCPHARCDACEARTVLQEKAEHPELHSQSSHDSWNDYAAAMVERLRTRST
jgi:hypothetical protein